MVLLVPCYVDVKDLARVKHGVDIMKFYKARSFRKLFISFLCFLAKGGTRCRKSNKSIISLQNYVDISTEVDLVVGLQFQEEVELIFF